MSTAATSLPDWIPLPAELSAKAREVPSLPERVLRFIRLEVEMNEQRRRRYHPETLALVQRARARVEKREAKGVEPREATMQDFHANYAEIVKSL